MAAGRIQLRPAEQQRPRLRVAQLGRLVAGPGMQFNNILGQPLNPTVIKLGVLTFETQMSKLVGP